MADFKRALFGSKSEKADPDQYQLALEDIETVMQTQNISYKRHRFPCQIIAHVVWFYARFNLSLREVEESMLKRGVDVSYETIQRWVTKFGPLISCTLRRR